jgi:hypothetical protein
MWSAIDEGCVTVSSGRLFRVASPARNAVVTRELRDELGRVLERFAAEAGFDQLNKVAIGFRPGSFGHHKLGRAADIYEVGGLGLDVWKNRWDKAAKCAAVRQDVTALDLERRRNLGWRLYKALQNYGRWAQPYGYPIQLFGPWTRSEGPWKYISDFLLKAHRDHIHVAR